MRTVLIAGGLALGLASCGKGFIEWRDYGRVAECYGAFISVSSYTEDPALGFSPEQIALQQQVTLGGINRMTPFTIAAQRKAGGDRPFLDLVAVWRLKPENDIVMARTPEAKHKVYQHILSEASKCQEDMTRWGAPKYAPPSPSQPPAT